MSFTKLNFIAFLVCFLAAMFYMYEFALQVSLGVLTNELMHDLNLNAVGLGVVSAFFFYAYMPMQVPAGLLHDRFGPRLILTLAILVCSFGALFFSYSTTIWQASLGRFMMGIGGAFSFSGALMLISRWFKPQYFAILSGLVQLMSSVGAISGELLLAIAIKQWDWRPTLFYLFIIGLVLAGLVALIVHNFPKGVAYLHTAESHAAANTHPPLREVFARSQPWWIAIFSFLIWAPIAAFAGLWGIPFLVAAYHLTTASASLACAAIWIGIGVGSPLLGWISEHLQRRCVVISFCGAIGMISSALVIYCILPMPLLYLALFLLGFAGGAQSLAFSIVRDVNHPRVLGAAIGLNNMATVAGGAILQPIIGYLLHVNWNGMTTGSIPVYEASAYHIALIMLPFFYLFAMLISLKCIRETYCKPVFSLLRN